MPPNPRQSQAQRLSAHSPEELRPRRDLTDTVCLRFIAGNCKSGRRCKYRHAIPEEHASSQSPSNLEEEPSPVETLSPGLQWNSAPFPPPTFQVTNVSHSPEVFAMRQECNRGLGFVASHEQQLDNPVEVHASTFERKAPLMEDVERELTLFRNSRQDDIRGPYFPFQEVVQPQILMRMSL
eukprot:TRINITY_DN93876_c0_g1_i1.p1 TRINITY_DN93876_c0_g1~~TRINITY_DN93876_c0_g1_i1.p1  ORF type:complete len:181 (+),score=10.59 TRINITY_DN93876_c0_g1_i1:124-666(+)